MHACSPQRSPTLAPVAALAQNIAIVNGKAVPTSRVDALTQQLAKSGRPVTPEMQGQLRDEVITREVFMQEAQKRGLDVTDDFKLQMELARQSLLIRELFNDYQKKNPVTDADAKAEYDKFVAANGGKEYKARHILVENEAEAKAIIASLKKGGKFEEIAKKSSKDPGSGANGGDLDWAAAGSYVHGVLRGHGRAGKRQDHRDPGQVAVRLPRDPPGRRARSAVAQVRRSQAADPRSSCSSRNWPTFQQDLRAKAKVE